MDGWLGVEVCGCECNERAVCTEVIRQTVHSLMVEALRASNWRRHPNVRHNALPIPPRKYLSKPSTCFVRARNVSLNLFDSCWIKFDTRYERSNTFLLIKTSLLCNQPHDHHHDSDKYDDRYSGIKDDIQRCDSRHGVPPPELFSSCTGESKGHAV